MTDKYKLPEPEALRDPNTGNGLYYTEAQMHQAFQAGRDSMKAESVKECEELPDGIYYFDTGVSRDVDCQHKFKEKNK